MMIFESMSPETLFEFLTNVKIEAENNESTDTKSYRLAKQAIDNGWISVADLHIIVSELFKITLGTPDVFEQSYGYIVGKEE